MEVGLAGNLQRGPHIDMASNLRWMFLVILFFVFAAVSAFGARNEQLLSNGLHSVGPLVPDPEEGTCKSMVEIYGYECEEHTVTTEDGYILSMQRIPVGRTGRPKGTENRPPVLLQHGVMMDGITWLLNLPDQSLAFILADSGFDVWIANTRGTLWSRRHTSLTPDDPAYWDWTWDELVTYDLPATFQYVSDQTSEKLHYVGHSLGTLMALASFSQDKLLTVLRSAALLSPIAYVGQITSPLARLAAKTYVAENLYKAGIVEFDPKGPAVGNILKTLCKTPGTNCYDLMTSFTGPNCCLNSSTVDLFLEHEPQPTATKNMVHIAQMIRDGTIKKFDYGDEGENKKHYGQAEPPVYNMASIPNHIPLFFSYGGVDALSDVNDVENLLKDLTGHDGDKLTVQLREDYAHADFVMAVNANEIVYQPLIAFFKLQ